MRHAWQHIRNTQWTEPYRNHETTQNSKQAVTFGLAFPRVAIQQAFDEQIKLRTS
jgi:hypothetical protein